VKLNPAVRHPAVRDASRKIPTTSIISLDHIFPIRHPGFHRVHPVAGVGLQAPTVASSLATPDT
jgi:hypothetical protein